MSYSNIQIEEIHNLQEKLDTVSDDINVSDVLVISEEIDTIIDVK